MRCTSIEGFLGEARACIESSEGQEVEIGRNDDVVGGVEAWVGLVADIAVDDVDFNAWVELLDLGSCCFGALYVLAWSCARSSRLIYVLAYVGIADEELRAKVFLGDNFMVCERDGSDSSEHKVLGDLVGERLDGDEQDVGGANSGRVSCNSRCATSVLLLFSLNTPEADLSVVEGDLIRRDLVGFGHGSYRLSSCIVRREGAIGDWRRGRSGHISMCCCDGVRQVPQLELDVGTSGGKTTERRKNEAEVDMPILAAGATLVSR